MISVDNRQHVRVEVEFPLNVQLDSGPWVVRAVNLSVNGIRIHSLQSLPLNVPVVLHFPFKWQRTFTIARVVNRQGNVYGCQFIDLPHKVHELLDKALLSCSEERPAKVMRTLWETS